MQFAFKKQFFGLDISDLSLKIVKAEKRGSGFVIVSLGEAKIPAGVIEKGEVKDKKTLSDILTKALKKVKGKKITTKNVVCSVPEEKSFVDILRLPATAQEQDITTMVEGEAENRIPFPLSEVYFDFEKVSTRQPNKTFQEVVLAACPKRVVEAYFEVLDLAGLCPVAMEVESFAIARAIFAKDDFSGPVLIVDLGQTRTSFVMFSDKNVKFTSTIPFSSDVLTQTLAQIMKLSPAKAEVLKIKEGLTGKKKVFEAMTPALNDLAEQIRTYLNYYKSHVVSSELSLKEKAVEKILLCGGGASLKGLGEFLTSQLGMQVGLADCLKNILRKEQKVALEINKQEALSFTTALGLSQREIYGN